jgi:hypothetical protein
VGPDGAGGFVVVWMSGGSSGTDTSQESFQGQRYTSAGTAVGAQFQVNTYTTSSQGDGAVGPDGAGGFVVVWGSFGSSGTDTSHYSVQGQRFVGASTTSTTLPPSIPVLSGSAHLLLTALLAFAILVLGFAWRSNRPAG